MKILCDFLGNIDYPPEESNGDGSIVTIMKLADQEILDIVKYFTLNNNSSDPSSSTLTTPTEISEPEEESESAVIKVIKLADEQLKDIVEYWQSTTAPSTRQVSSTTTVISTVPSKTQVNQVTSNYLKILKDTDFSSEMSILSIRVE